MISQSERSKLKVLLVSIPLLAACGQQENFEDLQSLITSVRARPAAGIEPVPEFTPYQRYDYSAASLRSPFQQLPETGKQTTGIRAQDARPDLERVRELLENYPLSELAMVGTLSRDGDYQALIEDSGGALHRVGVGKFMGRNHGKVQSIDANQVFLIELVPVSGGGWIERPQTLSLQRPTGP